MTLHRRLSEGLGDDHPKTHIHTAHLQIKHNLLADRFASNKSTRDMIHDFHH